MSEWVSCFTVSRPPTTAHSDVRASRASRTNPSYARRVPVTFAERRPWKPVLAARRPRQPALPLNPPTRYVTCRQIWTARVSTDIEKSNTFEFQARSLNKGFLYNSD